MKHIFGKVETVFDIAYLLIAFTIGMLLVLKSSEDVLYVWAGAAALILAVGDCFHLIPRVWLIRTKNEKRFRKAVGRGKQITSITMTFFYLILLEIGIKLADGQVDATSSIFLVLVIIRIVLCLLPQNRWTEMDPPVSWGIIRNVPFIVMGLMVSWQYFTIEHIYGLSFMWLAVILSFGFYLPVVLFSNRNRMIGMLMLPKTCMYVWILVMFLNMQL